MYNDIAVIARPEDLYVRNLTAMSAFLPEAHVSAMFQVEESENYAPSVISYHPKLALWDTVVKEAFLFDINWPWPTFPRPPVVGREVAIAGAFREQDRDVAIMQGRLAVNLIDMNFYEVGNFLIVRLYFEGLRYQYYGYCEVTEEDDFEGKTRKPTKAKKFLTRTLRSNAIRVVNLPERFLPVDPTEAVYMLLPALEGPARRSILS